MSQAVAGLSSVFVTDTGRTGCWVPAPCSLPILSAAAAQGWQPVPFSPAVAGSLPRFPAVMRPRATQLLGDRKSVV